MDTVLGFNPSDTTRDRDSRHQAVLDAATVQVRRRPTSQGGESNSSARLGLTDSAVLDRLDPPLNLQGRPRGPVRIRLTELRRSRAAASDPTAPAGPDFAPEQSVLNEIERRFHQEMVAIYGTAKREVGYSATRFLQMTSEHGGMAPARQLLWSDQPSDGFTALWSHHRLDLTVEAHVLKQEYLALFTDDDRRQARSRLELYGWHDNPELAM
jgi:hypothetical protein